MSPSEFISVLRLIIDPRFNEAVALLVEASATGGSQIPQISTSSRTIPGSELVEIYALRRAHCRKTGSHVAGLEPLVDVLSAESKASWTLLNFVGGGRWGLVFLRGGGEPCACIAAADKTDTAPGE